MTALVPAGDVSIDAEDLDPGRVAALLEARARAIGRIVTPETPGETVIACTIGGETFGLPIAAVAEILPAAAATPIPGAPAGLLGLVATRGALYNLFDPAPALGLTRGPAAHMLLLRGPAPRIALLIEEARGSIVLKAGPARNGDGLTTAAITADGDRLGLIAPGRLIEALGLARKGDG